MTRKYNITIGQFPYGSISHPDVNAFLAHTYHKMKTDERIDKIFWYSVGDTPITMTRNQCVYEAIQLGVDYILMVDSDMGPDYLVGRDPQARPFWDVAWGFMMNRRSDEDAYVRQFRDGQTYSDLFPPATIAAPYCGPPPKELPYIFRWKNYESNDPNEHFKLEMLEREDAAMRSGIEEVAALPTGLILYDVRVFKELEAAGALPWFDYEYTDKYCRQKCTTEDVFQTRNAHMLDLPLYVAWDCWGKHWKHKGVEKPSMVTRAQVQGSMRKALASKYEDQNERIHIVNRHDPKHAVVGSAGQAEAENPQQVPGPVPHEDRSGVLSGVAEPDNTGDAGKDSGRERPHLSPVICVRGQQTGRIFAQTSD